MIVKRRTSSFPVLLAAVAVGVVLGGSGCGAAVPSAPAGPVRDGGSPGVSASGALDTIVHITVDNSAGDGGGTYTLTTDTARNISTLAIQSGPIAVRVFTVVVHDPGFSGGNRVFTMAGNGTGLRPGTFHTGRTAAVDVTLSLEYTDSGANIHFDNGNSLSAPGSCTVTLTQFDTQGMAGSIQCPRDPAGVAISGDFKATLTSP